MKKYVIGVDIGGTKIAAGLVDPRSFQIIRIATFPTQREKGRYRILANIVASIQSVRDEIKITAIGLGSAGHVDPKKGVVHSHWSLGWGSVPVVSILKKQFHVPVYVDNDANCFTLAESLRGAGKGLPIVAGMTLGTGVGGGIVMNGKIYHGRDSSAGEVGHMIIRGFDQKALRCTCQVRGHLEVYGSGSARTRLEHVRGRAKADEEIARAVAIGAANLITIINPDCIIIGGGAGLRPGLVPRIKKHLAPLLYDKQFQTTKIRRAKLGRDAGIIGAALLTRNHQ